MKDFSAYAADDGEVVFVSEHLDALMECSAAYGCTIHDGVKPPPVALAVWVPFDDRANAGERLQMARDLVRRSTISCVGQGQ